MTHLIDEEKFVSICMKELGDHDEIDKKIAYAVAAAINWSHYKENINNNVALLN